MNEELMMENTLKRAKTLAYLMSAGLLIDGDFFIKKNNEKVKSNEKTLIDLNTIQKAQLKRDRKLKVNIGLSDNLNGDKNVK